MIRILIILAVLCSSVWAATPRIDPSTDMTYLGVFRPPDSNTLEYSGYGIAYNPIRDSIFISNYNSNATIRAKIAEISIPSTLSQAKAYNLIGAASQSSYVGLSTVGTPFVTIDIINNYSVSINNPYMRIGGMLYMTAKGSQVGAKLWLGFDDWYNQGNENFKSLAYVSPTTLTSDQAGNWYVGPSGTSTYANRVGRYLLEADNAWIDAHSDFGGRYLMTGFFRGGGNNSSYGPTLYAMNPFSNPPPADGTVITPIKLLEYTSDGQFDSWTTAGLESLTGAAWISRGGKHAIVFPSRRGTLPGCYHCYDPCLGGNNDGYMGYPYYMEWVWFDVDDIDAVAAGRKQPYEPQPYSYYTPTDTWSNTPCANRLLSSTYDAATGRLFVAEYVAYGGSSLPIIHVFQFAEGTAQTRKASGGGTIAGSVH